MIAWRTRTLSIVVADKSQTVFDLPLQQKRELGEGQTKREIRHIQWGWIGSSFSWQVRAFLKNCGSRVTWWKCRSSLHEPQEGEEH